MANKDSLILNLTATNDKLKYKLDESKAQMIKLKEIANKQKIKLAGDNAELQSKLKESQDSLKELQNKAKESGGGFNILKTAAGGAGNSILGVVKGFGAMLAPVAVGMTAMEGFNRTIAGSQTLTDEMGRSMAAVSSVTDNFFASLASGSFSGFLDGLKDVIANAKDAYNAMDDLGTITLYTDVDLARIDTQLLQKRYEAKDERNTEAQRKQAQVDVEKLEQEYENVLKAKLDATLNAANASFKDALTVQGYKGDANLSFSNDEATKQKAIYEQLNQKIVDEKERMLAEFSKYQNLRDDSSNKEDWKYYDTRAQTAWRSSRGVEARIKESNEYKIAKAYTEVNDEVLKNISGLYVANEKLQQQFIQKQNRNLNTYQRDVSGGGSENKSGGSSDKTLKIPTQIDVQKIDAPQIPAITNSINSLNTQIKHLDKLFNASTDDGERNALRDKIESLKKTIDALKKGGTSDTTDLDTYRTPPQPILEAESNYSKQIEGLNAIAGLMGTISNATDNNTASWIAWGGSVLQATAAAIPAIASVTAAKSAEATANTAAAASGAASSVASIPYIGPLLAVGAVASVIAAILTAPKFETGGIVGGSSFYGDNILARVNSGEMILNKGQQNNLFNMINGGNNKSSAGSGQVVFEIKGDKLLGVLNNTKNKRR